MDDNVLRNAWRVLNEIASDEIFISRSCGEEFAVIVQEGADEINLIAKIKHPLCLSPVECIPTQVSIGVALKSANQTSSSSLAAADAALYESKRMSKNRITYATEHD